MAKVNVSLPDELLDDLDALTSELGSSRSGLVREATARYVAELRAEQAARERETEIRSARAGMRVLAGQLKMRSKSNHPLIDRDATQLRRDIERALDQIRMTSPPNYYRAGRVAGACTYCHVLRHEGS